MSEIKEQDVKTKVKYPPAFYSANTAEMFERAAYYCMFISITLYLTDVVGFTDIDAGWIAGAFSALLYFAPTFAGVIADKIGYKKSLLIAFTCLSVGYFMMAFLCTKPMTILNLSLIELIFFFVQEIT